MITYNYWQFHELMPERDLRFTETWSDIHPAEIIAWGNYRASKLSLSHSATVILYAVEIDDEPIRYLISMEQLFNRNGYDWSWVSGKPKRDISFV